MQGFSNAEISEHITDRVKSQFPNATSLQLSDAIALTWTYFSGDQIGSKGAKVNSIRLQVAHRVWGVVGWSVGFDEIVEMVVSDQSPLFCSIGGNWLDIPFVEALADLEPDPVRDPGDSEGDLEALRQLIDRLASEHKVDLNQIIESFEEGETDAAVEVDWGAVEEFVWVLVFAKVALDLVALHRIQTACGRDEISMQGFHYSA